MNVIVGIILIAIGLGLFSWIPRTLRTKIVHTERGRAVDVKKDRTSLWQYVAFLAIGGIVFVFYGLALVFNLPGINF